MTILRSSIDIQNRRFGMLTALFPTENRDSKGYVLWHCRCDCGRETDISYNNLMYTARVSCGCHRKARSAVLESALTRVAGTSVDILKSKKLPRNNTTGHKGIYFYRGKYLAKISFQKKQYHLGSYEHIEDAIKARQAAEAELFNTTAEFYDRWKAEADRNPGWAEENPVRIEVHQREDRTFSLSLFPVIE